jgi:hypothetical protein
VRIACGCRRRLRFAQWSRRCIARGWFVLPGAACQHKEHRCGDHDDSYLHLLNRTRHRYAGSSRAGLCSGKRTVNSLPNPKPRLTACAEPPCNCIRLGEQVEYARQHFRRDALAGVFDMDDGIAIIERRLHPDSAPRRGEFDGVLASASAHRPQGKLSPPAGIALTTSLRRSAGEHNPADHSRSSAGGCTAELAAQSQLGVRTERSARSRAPGAGYPAATWKDLVSDRELPFFRARTASRPARTRAWRHHQSPSVFFESSRLRL